MKRQPSVDSGRYVAALQVRWKEGKGRLLKEELGRDANLNDKEDRSTKKSKNLMHGTYLFSSQSGHMRW